MKRVFLAGVKKGASEQELKLAVRNAAEAATDFSWLSRGDAATLAEKTAEANTVSTLITKQRLVISAADKLLTTFGPDKGYVFEPDKGLIIASDSVLAHDMVSLAWLLENRRNIPASERDGFIDTSKRVPRIVNHVVTYWLGGWKPALTSETLSKNSLNSIWDDRTLTRSYELRGGVPDVQIASANSALPEDLKNSLAGMTAPPA